MKDRRRRKDMQIGSDFDKVQSDLVWNRMESQMVTRSSVFQPFLQLYDLKCLSSPKRTFSLFGEGNIKLGSFKDEICQKRNW